MLTNKDLRSLITHAFDGALRIAEALPEEQQLPYILRVQSDMRAILKKLMSQLKDQSSQ